jgi:hypothetical protein
MKQNENVFDKEKAANIERFEQLTQELKTALAEKEYKKWWQIKEELDRLLDKIYPPALYRRDL